MRSAPECIERRRTGSTPSAYRHKRLNQNDQYHRAFDALRSAGIVALPTDTIYGLVAVASDEGAVARLLDIKGRPEGKPLPLFVASIEQAELIATFTEPARLLAERFWPGALTLVLDCTARVRLNVLTLNDATENSAAGAIDGNGNLARAREVR